MRNRFSLLIGLIAIVLTVGTAPAAHAGTPVPQPYSCGSGNVLIGFQGHLGVWIDQLQPVCANWDVAHQKFGPEQPGPTFGNIHGGSVDLSRAVCGPNEAVAKIAYGWAVPNGPPGHVQALAVTCAPMATAQPDANPISLGNQPGSSKFASYPCPGAQVAAGVTIYLDGVNISDLYPECQNPPATPPAATSQSHFGYAAKRIAAEAAASASPSPAPAPAPVPGSWYQSCSNASLYQNVLTASCKSTTGLNVTTTLDLTTCNQPPTAANINGKLVCENGVASPSGSGGTGGYGGYGGSGGYFAPIEGDWNSSEGPMTFTQLGPHRLEGAYAQDSGRVRAMRQGGHWVGVWSESKADVRCSHPKLGSYFWGQLDFVFSNANRHFDGTWSYCDGDPSGGKPWTGDRIK